MVSFDATLLDSMLTIVAIEMLKNYCTYGTKRTPMVSKCQLKIKATSRHDRAKNWAHDGKNCLIMVEKGHWLTVGTMHCAFPIVSQGAC